MALLKEEKQTIIGDNARGDADTGSPEVQVALLSQRISELTEHLKTHQRSPLPSRPAADGRTQPPPPRVPEARGHRALPSIIGKLGLRR